MSTAQPREVTIRKVDNGYLVIVPAAGATGRQPMSEAALGRLYIAHDTWNIPDILDDDVWPELEVDPESEIPGTIEEFEPAPTIEDLEASGAIVRGAEVTYSPATDDGYEYPKVTRKGSRWTIHCPAHGPQRGEFRDNADFLRCTRVENKVLCTHPGVPKPIAQRMADASQDGDA